MPYYLNLSLLSNILNTLPKEKHVKRLSAEAWRIVSLCAGGSFAQEDIAREARGRPFFPNRDADFSISHSGALAAVSFVTGKGARTGCDVELVRPRAGARAIAEKYFTVPERDYIASGGGFDITRFYKIWTLKECFLKLRGGSVFDMAAVPSFISGEGQSLERFVFSATGVSSIIFNLYELAGSGGDRYILATAIEGTETEQAEIRWFSQEALVCTSIAKINAAPSPAETVRPKI